MRVGLRERLNRASSGFEVCSFLNYWKDPQWEAVLFKVFLK